MKKAKTAAGKELPASLLYDFSLCMSNPDPAGVTWRLADGPRGAFFANLQPK